ncbi:MAG TPA: hypothetical protein VHF69_00745 [Candidatus Synoicihabitans sp.]|nr:hypothetical protein [Candidatus Synoicihabitans sp.]
MNRWPLIVFAPEVIVAGLTVVICWYCARHYTYSDSDVRSMERLLWLLPLLFVGAAFATFFVTGHRTWSWLLRANLAAAVGLGLVLLRAVGGLGAPGSGPKGQEAAFILVIAFAMILGAVANTFAGALILRANRPTLDGWYVEHPLRALALTGVAAIPVFFVQLVGFGLLAGVVGFVTTLMRRG